MNEQTLELQIQSKAQSALSNVDKLVSKLTSLERTVSSIDSKLKTGSVNNANSNVNQLKNTIDKTTSSTDKLGSALKSVFTFTGVKRLTQSLLGWMNEAVDYTEQLNLFNVVFDNIERNGKQTFSELGKSATQFQYKLNEKFGTNKTETLYMQGIFQSMGETVGIKDKYSAIMSETMTKLTYDLASLYNKSEDKVAEALRAGVYAGQTKPLRSYGIDVTQMSMQPILDSLGIDEQVKNMSQAEKEILRYLATMKQAQIAMGDFANTIESPSNQLKVFRQQLVETKVALSSLFIGAFSQILPYANAILMVIKEVTKAIASMFGIKLKDYNSGIASVDKYSDSLGGVGDSAGKASKKVKELKREVLGFDEIHNINENKNSGSGSSGSGGTSGGIDQRLLDAIKGYDNGMDKVRMKATQIRDKIMEWLGFTKEIDPLTGEVSWKYGGIDKTLSNIIKWWKGLNTQGKLWASLGIALGFVNLFRILSKFAKLTGISKLFSTLSTVFTSVTSKLGLLSSGFSGLASTLGISTGALGLIIAGVVALTGSLIHAYNTNDTFKNKVNDMVSSVSGLFKDLFGVITSTVTEIWGITKPIWNIMKENVVAVVKIIYETIVFAFSNIFDTISGTCKIISDLIHGDFNKAFEDMGKMAINLFENWKTWFSKVNEIFATAVKNIINSIIDFVPKAINKMTEIVTWLKELPNKFFYYAGQAVGTMWKTITKTNWLELGKKVLIGIANGILNIGTALANFGVNLWNKTKDAIKQIDWKHLGINILDGIIDGMFGFGRKLKNWGKSFVSGIKDALGIHSPSRLVIDAKVGNYTTDGILTGMEDEIPKLKRTAETLIEETQKTFADAKYKLNLNYDIPESIKNINPDCSILQEFIINGMSQAMSQFDNQSSEIDVHVHTDEGTIVDRINQRTKQTGVCPINIPV